MWHRSANCVIFSKNSVTITTQLLHHPSITSYHTLIDLITYFGHIICKSWLHYLYTGSIHDNLWYGCLKNLTSAWSHTDQDLPKDICSPHHSYQVMIINISSLHMDCIIRSVDNMVATKRDELVSVDHLSQPLICCFRFFQHTHSPISLTCWFFIT